MLTIIPSPLLPLTVAVTTTSVSLLTKFRIHLSFFALCPGCATRSNFNACELNGNSAIERRSRRGRKGRAKGPAIMGNGERKCDERKERCGRGDGVVCELRLGRRCRASNANWPKCSGVRQNRTWKGRVTWAVKNTFPLFHLLDHLNPTFEYSVRSIDCSIVSIVYLTANIDRLATLFYHHLHIFCLASCNLNPVCNPSSVTISIESNNTLYAEMQPLH